VSGVVLCVERRVCFCDAGRDRWRKRKRVMSEEDVRRMGKYK